MKVAYPIKYHEDAEPPEHRIGSVPRWKDVTDNLQTLIDKGGVMTIHVPRQGMSKEAKSLRAAISRAKKKQGLKHRFSVQLADQGIKVWARPPRGPDERVPFEPKNKESDQ